MSDETSRRVGLKITREPLSTATEAFDQGAADLYEFGSFGLEPAERKLSRNNEPVLRTPKAFDTLVLLVRNSGHLLEKDELIRTLWPDSFVEEGNLSNNIFVLRRALGEDARYIETIPKRGYRFVGAVRQLPSPSARLKDRPHLELATPVPTLLEMEILRQLPPEARERACEIVRAEHFAHIPSPSSDYGSVQ